MSNPRKTKYWRIISRYDGETCTVRLDGIIFNQLQHHAWHKGENQKFLLIDAGNDFYYIASKHSGDVVDVGKGWGFFPNDLQMFPFHGLANQQFRIIETEEKVKGTSQHYHYVEAKNGLAWQFLEMEVPGHGSQKLMFTLEPYQPGGSAELFHWAAIENVPIPTIRPSEIEADTTSIIPRMKSLNDSIGPTTEKKRVGDTLIPYIFVNDDIGKARQVKETPYYRLTREQYWWRPALVEHSGASEETVVRKFRSTITEERHREVESKLHITHTKDFGVKFAEIFNTKIATTIEADLRIKESHTTTRVTEEEVIKTIILPKKHVVISVWVLVDRYVLERANGSLVMDWEIVRVSEGGGNNYIREIPFYPGES